MEKIFHVLFLLLFLCFPLVVQAENSEEYQKATSFLLQKGEVYFTFPILDRAELDSLTKIVSIDNVKELNVFAYANKKEFTRFRMWNREYTVLPHPGDPAVKPKMIDFKKDGTKAWDGYPTYQGYVALMQQFAADYPDLCRIVDAGTTVNNRKILFAVISDNVTTHEPEPQVMYTGTMHGDETAGYVTLLHLIDSLLSGYASNAEIRSLVNATSIWINPLANPDGTYAAGDASVAGATRYNAHSVDLNRNFPNILSGDHPDGNTWQPETQIMMNVAQSQQFTLSANFHGGAEVLNYPWDTWTSSVNRSPDDAYWQRICREFVDTVHMHSPAEYMTYLDNGITNGGDWYIVYGSRQDYMGHYAGCREITIEMSNTKLVPAAALPDLWAYTCRSLFNYIRQATFGIQGVITDETSGNPLKAKVTIVGHDRDNSEVFSTALSGDYYRPIEAGTFNVEFSAAGYAPQVLSATANYNEATIQNVALMPIKTTDKIVLNGTLLSNDGTPVGATAPETYDISVRLHGHQTAADIHYSETFLVADTQGVTIDKGHFRLILGSGTSSDDLKSVIQNNNNLWVELLVDGDVLSRIPLTAAPFVLSR